MSAIAIANARLVMLTADASSAEVIGNLQRFYPDVPVMTAVEYLAQRDELRKVGATDVFLLSTEGAIGFGRSALERLDVEPVVIDAIVDALRADDYRMLRSEEAGPRGSQGQPVG